MRILVVNWQDITNPLAGGAEVHLHEVFSRIAKKGHEVTLFCSTYPGAIPEEDINGIRVIREGGRYLFNFRFFFAYLTRLKRLNFDIVIDDMNKIPFFTPLFVREPLHGITHHLFAKSIFREVNLILATYVFVMERIAVWYYKLKRIPFIVGSPSTERELIEENFRKKNIHLVNYAVDHSRHTPDESKRSVTPFIGYFGRLKKYKSVDHLLRALPAVLNVFPNLKVAIVGEGDDRPRLEQIAAELGLSDAVQFLGFVSEEKKIELLQQMWFKVATSSKEGWGLTVIEANACGTPVLASNVQGLRDAVKNNETGLLYPYGDIDELSKKISSLLGNNELRQRLTDNSLKWAGTFDWDVAASRTLDLLEKRIAICRSKA